MVAGGRDAPTIRGTPTGMTTSSADGWPMHSERGGLATTLRGLVRIDPNLASGKVLLLCLTTDAVLILMHVLHLYSGVVPGPYYSIATDRGFGESFQYIKEGWIAAILLLMAMRTRSIQYACWGALFGLLAIDDLSAAREITAGAISAQLELGPMFGLRPRDVGELLIFAAVGGVLVLPIVLGWLYAGPSARAFGRSMVLLLVVFGAFTLVFDVIAGVARAYPPWNRLAAIVEEGGEMVVMSVILAFVFRTWHGNPDSGRQAGLVTELPRAAPGNGREPA